VTAGQRSAPVGLLGGTFDPVHSGHLRPAFELLQHLGLAEMRLMPGRVPPHRRPPRAPPAYRLARVRDAVAGVPGLGVEDCELQRDGPSYTVETLQWLRRELGPTRPLFFAMGSDAFRGLMGWHRWRELTDYAHLVVMLRAGSALSDLPAELDDWLARRRATGQGLRRVAAGGILTQAVSPLAVSSTGIRRLLAQGLSARYLMPDAVWDGIAAAGIYGYPQAA